MKMNEICCISTEMTDGYAKLRENNTGENSAAS
jgi:hypothetical protein